MNPNHLSAAEQRARTILDAYGSRPEQWPHAERQATLACITRSSALQHYQAQLAQLDRLIESEQHLSLAQTTNQASLQQRILDQLPCQASISPAVFPVATSWRRIIDWFVSPRFALAATSIAVLAIFLLIPLSPPRQTMHTVSTEFESWAWYDVTGQELPAASTTSMLTMMDLIELEVNEDGG